MIDSDVDCLIDSLKQLLDFNYPTKISKTRWILKERDRVELLYKELTLLRTFLSHSEETRYTNKKVRDLVIRIVDVANDVEDMFDSFILNDAVHKRKKKSKNKKKKKKTYYFDYDHSSLKLENVMQTIQVIKKDVSEIGSHKIKGASMYEEKPFRVTTSLPKEDKIDGFNVEAREILDRLVEDQKKLDVISIVGMGGFGKTTLAKRAYYDPYVVHHFYIRGWVTVSQTYQTKDLLLSICSSLSLTNAEMSIGKLREVLYKGLKGKRYLIVIDDIWSVEAWNDIRICFPNDNIGSRILVTSRLVNVALHIKTDIPPYILRFLTDEESWDLLQQKVFAEDATCPINLKKIGKQIAERCRGLPLAILVISGLLEKTENG